MTLILTLIGEFVLSLSAESVYITFAVGAIITLAMTLLEKQIENTVKSEISQNLSLYNIVEKIDDETLRKEIYQLATKLSLGLIPSHISENRVIGHLKIRQSWAVQNPPGFWPMLRV